MSAFLHPCPRRTLLGLLVALSVASAATALDTETRAATSTGLWALDNDLAGDDAAVFRPKAVVSRGALRQLARATDELLTSVYENGPPVDFHARRGAISAATLHGRSPSEETMQALTTAPAPRALWIQRLPYRSAILDLTRAHAMDQGVTERTRIEESVAARLQIYQEILGTQDAWRKFSGDTRDEGDVTLIPLRNLP